MAEYLQDVMTKHTVTLFMVEDDDVDAMLITDSLRQARIANPIERAVDGADALERLRGTNSPLNRGPVLLLVDINMPRMSGFDFLRHIREDERLKDLVAFMCTTSNQQQDKDLAKELNVVGYIIKNSSGSGLIKYMDTLDLHWRLMEMPDQDVPLTHLTQS